MRLLKLMFVCLSVRTRLPIIIMYVGWVQLFHQCGASALRSGHHEDHYQRATWSHAVVGNRVGRRRVRVSGFR